MSKLRDDMAEFPDYYSILMVKEDASPEEIRKAYRRLIQVFHPDTNREGRPDVAEEMSKVLNEAYEVLSDEAKRAEYDRRLAAFRAQQGEDEPEYPCESQDASSQDSSQVSKPLWWRVGHYLIYGDGLPWREQIPGLLAPFIVNLSAQTVITLWEKQAWKIGLGLILLLIAVPELVVMIVVGTFLAVIANALILFVYLWLIPTRHVLTRQGLSLLLLLFAVIFLRRLYDFDPVWAAMHHWPVVSSLLKTSAFVFDKQPTPLAWLLTMVLTFIFGPVVNSRLIGDPALINLSYVLLGLTALRALTLLIRLALAVPPAYAAVISTLRDYVAAVRRWMRAVGDTWRRIKAACLRIYGRLRSLANLLRGKRELPELRLIPKE